MHSYVAIIEKKEVIDLRRNMEGVGGGRLGRGLMEEKEGGSDVIIYTRL